MKRLFSLFIVAISFIAMVACNEKPISSTAPKSLNLFGQWEQIDSEFEGLHQGAVISGNTIEIYWIDDESDTRILYWSGTFSTPESAEESYSWISRNNTKKSELSLGASLDKTKEFMYNDNQISYSTTSGDFTCIVRLEKGDWAPDLNEGEFYESGNFSFPVSGIEFFVPEYFKKNMQDSTDGATMFAVNSAKLGSVRLIFMAVPVSQNEYDLEKGNIVEAMGGEKAHMLLSQEILLANLPGEFFSYSIINEYDVQVHMYGAFAYNTDESELLVIALSIARDEDFTNYFMQIIDSAKPIGQIELTDNSAPPSTPSSNAPSGIRPEFKKAMDSYEEFFDEYIIFMENFRKSSNPASMMADYTNYMTKYTETITAMNNIDDGTLSNEELAYYIEVQSRISGKLLIAAQ